MKTFASASMVLTLLVSGCRHEEPIDKRIRQFDPSLTAHWAHSVEQLIRPDVADGLAVHLWGTDSLVQSPIAIDIDDSGKLYYTTTTRQNNSEFDIRGHKDWEIRSTSMQTVEDRRNFLYTELSPANSARNTWLADLNGDSSHDWRDLTVEREHVYRLEDLSGDGVADLSQLTVDDFHDEVTDVAGGVLSYGKDLFVAVAPDLWRIRDKNGDGIADDKESLSHGYGVHIGFGGHGMSGVEMGPDGKIYWQIGDIGFNGKGSNGEQYAYPNSGVIVRANPDGSDFEVFASGLRNTHEFAFDEYGNLISEDNDGDHPGEKERLVYVVNGSDAGWRSNWQYGKYNDPDNNRYKVWMDEKMWMPRFEGQTAYIVPCISNFVSGPAGFVYNPGTALSPSYRKHFFVAEFVGNPAQSAVHSFTLNQKGAGFELGDHRKILGGVLPTGLDFGPDGCLYIADWINGWRTKNYGRIWKLDATAGVDTVERKQTKTLLAEDFSVLQPKELASLLGNADMRVRMKAQFELAGRGDAGIKIFQQVVSDKTNQLARVNAVWGISQMARKDSRHARSLLPLLHDTDAEIRAQAAKWLGDIRFGEAAQPLLPLLQDTNSRVRFFAAEALGRIKYAPATHQLIQLIKNNNDQDVYIRHAATLALARIGNAQPLIALHTDSSRAARIGAVIALRRMGDAGIAQFLNDKDEFVVTEAARGINDDLSIRAAMPALAGILNTTAFRNEALLRRSINANFRQGSSESMQNLIRFAANKKNPVAMRAEALDALGTWIRPSVLDRVDGRYRGAVHRDAAPARAAMAAPLAALLKDANEAIRVSAAMAIGKLGIADNTRYLLGSLKDDASPAVRAQSLRSLAVTDTGVMSTAIRIALSDKEKIVRVAGIDLVSKLHVEPRVLVPLLSRIIATKTSEEKQEALLAIGNLPVKETEFTFNQLLDKLAAGKLPGDIEIELADAIDSSGSPELKSRYKQIDAKRSKGNLVSAYQGCLYGGSEERGRHLFLEGEATQCTRCHSYNDMGGTAGPRLNGVASRISRQQILQALVEPSARLAPGFGVVELTLKNGQTLSGVLMEENENSLTIKMGNEPAKEISKNAIANRVNATSSMPEFRYVLSKNDIRDLVSFLSTLKKE